MEKLVTVTKISFLVLEVFKHIVTMMEYSKEKKSAVDVVCSM